MASHPPTSTHDSLAARLTAAVAFVVVPVGLAIVPFLVPVPDAETGRELFERLAADQLPYLGLVAQAVGVAALVPAAIAVVHLVRRAGRRGRVLAHLGAAIAAPAVFGGLLVLGMELAQARIVLAGPDRAAAVEDALVVNEWPPFLLAIAVTLLGAYLALLALASGLARARLVPAWAPALFVLPVLGALVPGAVAEWLTLGAMVLTCAALALLLLRPRTPATSTTSTVPRQGAVDRDLVKGGSQQDGLRR